VLWSFDTGTTYSCSALMSIEKGKTSSDVRNHDINFVKEYDGDQMPYGKIGVCTPMSIYYDQDPNSKDYGKILWGWSVVQRLKWPEDPIHQHSDRHVSQFKLLLDETQRNTSKCMDLRRKLNILKEEGQLETENDVLYQYLVKWLSYCRESRPTPEGVEPVFIITAPSVWDMRSSMEWYGTYVKAIREVWGYGENTMPTIWTMQEATAAVMAFLWYARYDVPVSESFDFIFVSADRDRLASVSWEWMQVAVRQRPSLIGGPKTAMKRCAR
jgi:hypothetical protein